TRSRQSPRLGRRLGKRCGALRNRTPLSGISPRPSSATSAGPARRRGGDARPAQRTAGQPAPDGQARPHGSSNEEMAFRVAQEKSAQEKGGKENKNTGVKNNGGTVSHHYYFVVCVPGGVLLSHTLSGAVPSALEGLASGFGMWPGVSPPLWPPWHHAYRYCVVPPLVW